jgi:hypothetical protein
MFHSRITILGILLCYNNMMSAVRQEAVTRRQLRRHRIRVRVCFLRTLRICVMWRRETSIIYNIMYFPFRRRRLRSCTHIL